MGFLLRRLGYLHRGLHLRRELQFPVAAAAAGRSGRDHVRPGRTALPPESLTALKATFGFLDEPLPLQYLHYLESVFTWNPACRSSSTRRPSARCCCDPCPGPCCWSRPRRCWPSRSARWRAHARPGGAAAGSTVSWHRAPSCCKRLPPLVTSLLALFLFAISLKWLPTGFAWDPDDRSGFLRHRDRQRALPCRAAGSRPWPWRSSAATS
ncbi:MAG: hypothetical protein WDN69_10865 [Aliidongia sp.]